MLQRQERFLESIAVMVRDVAIIGAGGIGQRHAQSCATLPASDYRLHLVEPNELNRQRTSELLNGRQALHWYKSVGELPKAIDLAIVATCADIRATVTSDVLARTDARKLILEKVLFQKLSDYSTIGARLAQDNAVAWVNCARRMWPGYKELREKLRNRDVVRIDMAGADWDIGCNGIHFIDLIAFLTQGAEIVVDEVRLGSIRSAKREGMLHIEGEIEGRLTRGTTNVPFSVVSSPMHQGQQVIRVKLSDGVVVISESVATMAIDWVDGSQTQYAIPFQSQLSAPAVRDILDEGRCDLASYEESRALHQAYIEVLIASLGRAGKLADPAVCPIT